MPVRVGPALVVDRRHQLPQAQARHAAEVVDRRVEDVAPQRRHGHVGADGIDADARSRHRRLWRAGDIARRDGVVGHLDGNVEDGLFVAAQPLRPAQGDVEGLLALDHLRTRLAADGDGDGVLHVRHTDVPELAPGPIDGELQVRLALDAEDGHVLQAGHGVEHGLDLVGQFLQLVEVGADDLDRVVALDAGQRLHDVVADVLREVPVHADQLAVHLLVHGCRSAPAWCAARGPSQLSQPVRGTTAGQCLSGCSGMENSAL